jgi:hypothetical protein
MGTPFYHTDESAMRTVKEYQDIQGLPTFEDALMDMAYCIDDLDSADRSAFRHVMRIISKPSKP